jgi:hypothetical protein
MHCIINVIYYNSYLFVCQGQSWKNDKKNSIFHLDKLSIRKNNFFMTAIACACRLCAVFWRKNQGKLFRSLVNLIN